MCLSAEYVFQSAQLLQSSVVACGFQMGFCLPNATKNHFVFLFSLSWFTISKTTKVSIGRGN